MKLLLPGVALVALAAAAAGCGGSSPATKLTIEVGGNGRADAYRLECGPVGGTAPQPRQICSALAHQSNLLVGGPAIDHSCPAAPGQKIVRVSGSYRGHAVDASFPPPQCSWVPGQGGGLATWIYLMHGAGTGVAETELGSPPITAAERATNRRKAARFHRLLLRDRRLTRERLAAISAGRQHVAAGAPPDRVALEVLRNQVVAESLLREPQPFDARVYSTTRRRAEGEADLTRPPGGPVYLVLVHYAYRDYLGRIHRDDSPWWSLIDARTLEGEGGGGGTSNLARLGASVALDL